MPKLRWAAAAVAASAALYAAVTLPAALRPAEGVDTVLFFDGVCNLCDGFVNFVADHDSSRRVRFGAIQRHADALHRAGAGRYAEGGAEALSTLVVTQGNAFYLRSDAALRVIFWQAAAQRAARADIHANTTYGAVCFVKAIAKMHVRKAAEVEAVYRQLMTFRMKIPVKMPTAVCVNAILEVVEAKVARIDAIVAADQDFTALLALRLGDKQGAPKVRGHVIINHATYGRIAPDGTARPNASIAKIGPDPLLDARGATDVLGERFAPRAVLRQR